MIPNDAAAVVAGSDALGASAEVASADYKRFDGESSDETDPDFYLTPTHAAAVVASSDALGVTPVLVTVAEYPRYGVTSSDATHTALNYLPSPPISAVTLPQSASADADLTR